MTHATKLQKFALEVSWKVALEAITINGILVDAHVEVSHPKYKHSYSVRTESWILEKVFKFAQQFSRPDKSLEKWQEVLSVLKSCNKYFISDVFFVLVKSYSISSIHLHCIVFPAFFKVRISHQFGTWSLEKEIIVLEKKSQKSLEFWIQKSVRTLSIAEMASNCFCWWQGKAFMSVSVLWQVISSTTGNKNCVSNIADSDILGFLFLTLHTLPSGTASGFLLFLSIILGFNWYVSDVSCVLFSDRLLTVDTMHALCSNTKLVKETMHKGKLLSRDTTWLKKCRLMLCIAILNSCM